MGQFSVGDNTVITKPSEGTKVWPGHLDIEGDVTLPAGAKFKLYTGFGKCTDDTATVIFDERLTEIPATIMGSRFTASFDYDPTSTYLPPCVIAYAIAADSRNARDLRHTELLTNSLTFVNTPTTVYAPTVEVEVVAILPPPVSTTRVEIGGVVATFNGTSYKATVSLQIGANPITATAYDGAAAVVSGGTNVTYVVPSNRTLDAYLGSIAINTTLPVALSEVTIMGTVSAEPETTVMIRDAQGATRFAVIRAYGALSETITAYPGFNEIVVTAYGPGGLSATKTLSFVNFALGDTPSVVITSPQSCSVISTQPTTVNIAADTFGAFNPVMFKSNGASIGTANANPVANFTYSNVQSGSYALTASFDYNLAPVNSKAVNFTVNLANASQTCSLVSPQNNARYALGSSIPLEATASATTGSITKVEFFDGTTLLASVTSAPYRYTWTTASNGNHMINVKATNNSGITVNCASAQLQVSASFGPVVTLPNPPLGTVFIEGGGAIITPTLSDIGGTINKVQLWRGTTMLKEETVAPFKFTLTNLAAGSYTLFARAFDNQGATSADSNSITFPVSVPPTISLNAPASGSDYTAPATIPISVSASVPDGTIQRVEISSNGSVIATLTSAPYTFNWTNVPAGSYAITANAFSNWGASLEAVLLPKRDVVVYAPIQVGTPNTSVVKLTAPANNSTVGTPVTLTVNAQNIAGTIATIEFLDGANQIIGYNINAASSNYTLNYVWTNPTSGSHTLTAKVKNSAGVVFTSAPVTVQISAAPAINLSAAGSFYLAPANVDLVIGTTVSAVGATLSRVEIYSSVVIGGISSTPTLVTTLTAPPYRYRLSNLAVGTYNITARAVDSLGNSSDSAPLEIRVGTAYGIVLPATLNGSTINGNTLSFIATINALANSSVTVNGVIATVSRDGRIVVNGLALTAGVNTITITVTPPTGAVLTQTFTVTRTTTPPSFEMTVSPTQGVAPLLSLVEVKNPGNTPFATELLSCDNPTGNVALAENQSTTLAGALECRYTKPGVYKPWAAIKDASGTVIWSSTKYVVVSGALDGLSVVRMVYSNMLDQLKAGNANGALGFLSGDAKTKYSAIFSALGTDLATIAGRLGAISTTTASDGVAEVVLTRDVNGVKQVFSIHLLRGEDGVWRIESM